MELLERVRRIGLVPVVAFESADQAVPCSRALREAQLDIIEITMRTAAGIESIRRVKAEFPDMVVGAGTVLTLEKAKEAVDAGAEFVVLPGYQEDVVAWCVGKGVAVLPGCVTPAEIQLALQKGLKVLKFFPADVYGGVKALKALNGPFGPSGVTFIPTGGVDQKNLADYVQVPFIAAVGGGWLCSSKQIKEADYAGITKTVKESIDVLLGFELGHVGFNTAGAEQSEEITKTLVSAFHFPYLPGNSANFAGAAVEVVKSTGLGKNGHVAIKTNNIDRAEYYLAKRGFVVDPATAKSKDGKTTAVYLKDEIGGFAFHLLQK
ncbi:MAG: bifunctional 4-hydroxy-2-oxoglutarate aldolase/2-dehydro-3-deoxy-phosphogluconate aldolase [Clostridiales bacterium]|jgi:2-dehydro-3-deoxyphosphogluconate aldolase/(4S)-4-hydroxy-2-oxoglutarate aldolase|nr:bifunctional 4-hydroxy-2-oxoglutarate aldolase/2-dehydro-3-deoxy-phosphogluconate aldolase [Clostridiales bacterium]